MAPRSTWVAAFLLAWLSGEVAVSDPTEVASPSPNGPLSGRITASEISSTAKALSTVSIGKEDVMLQEELASLGLDLSAKADPKKIVSTLEKARLEVKATYAKTMSRLIELEKKYVPEHAEKKKKAAAKKAAAALIVPGAAIGWQKMKNYRKRWSLSKVINHAFSRKSRYNLHHFTTLRTNSRQCAKIVWNTGEHKFRTPLISMLYNAGHLPETKKIFGSEFKIKHWVTDEELLNLWRKVGLGGHRGLPSIRLCKVNMKETSGRYWMRMKEGNGTKPWPRVAHAVEYSMKFHPPIVKFMLCEVIPTKYRQKKKGKVDQQKCSVQKSTDIKDVTVTWKKITMQRKTQLNRHDPCLCKEMDPPKKGSCKDLSRGCARLSHNWKRYVAAGKWHRARQVRSFYCRGNNGITCPVTCGLCPKHWSKACEAHPAPRLFCRAPMRLSDKDRKCRDMKEKGVCRKYSKYWILSKSKTRRLLKILKKAKTKGKRFRVQRHIKRRISRAAYNKKRFLPRLCAKYADDCEKTCNQCAVGFPKGVEDVNVMKVLRGAWKTALTCL